MKILFVCTGNIFRSMSAEYLAKKYITDNNIKNIKVNSAGTIAEIQNPFSYTVKCLEKYWCDVSKHIQRKATDEILKDQDFIICMAKHHKETIKSFWYESVLFNFIAYGKNIDVMDDTEYWNKYWFDYNLEKYVNEIVDYIHDAMPNVIKGLDGFEIERKFLIKKLPENINEYPSKKIIQWFFKDENDKTIRIRKVQFKAWIEYFQTIKKWHWLIRKEDEIKLSKENFDKMWKQVWNRYLEKTRYIIPFEKKEIEVDMYKGKNKWLVTAEIEFQTPLESRNFLLPKWFDKEITEDRKFTNANLAKK